MASFRRRVRTSSNVHAFTTMWSVDVLMPPPRIVNHSASTHEYIDALTNNETLVLPASLKSGKRKRNKIKKKMLPTGMKALFVALKAMN